MRREAGEGMTRRNITMANVLVYVATTFFFLIQNGLSSEEKTVYEKVIEKENIVAEDQRSTLRAFYTAPPVIPHEVKSQDSKDCLRCHQGVTKLDDGRVSPATPHPQFSRCLQCHAPGVPGGKDVGNAWHGLKEPKRGDRWVTLSPPTIPHRIFLRENCLSCHGPDNPDMRLRSSHPERTSCLQCHVPNYEKEF
jgi:cytochrome c-type protein NapB